MFTCILIILLCSWNMWKIETLILKLKDQKIQTMQLKGQVRCTVIASLNLPNLGLKILLLFCFAFLTRKKMCL